VCARASRGCAESVGRALFGASSILFGCAKAIPDRLPIKVIGTLQLVESSCRTVNRVVPEEPVARGADMS
jgi:hypothetical protein